MQLELEAIIRVDGDMVWTRLVKIEDSVELVRELAIQAAQKIGQEGTDIIKGL